MVCLDLLFNVLFRELSDSIDNLLSISNREEKGSATITGVDRETLDHLPLSFTQQRLWFLDQLSNEGGRASATYTIASVFRLGGALDVASRKFPVQVPVDNAEGRELAEGDNRARGHN